MAEYGRQTDDPTRHTDEYGNIVNRPGAGGGTDDKYATTGGTPTDDKYASSGGEYGTHGGQPTHGTTGTGDYGAHGGVVTHGSDTGLAEGGGHRRSGSSSSSEDDGEGGRRKKGLKEKIKEKLPGSKSSEEETYGTGITTGVGYEQEHHEKTKGMMEKIKEKLPGHH